MNKGMYLRFGIMIAISFVAMYVLMYAMVNVFGNAYSSFNQFYMAGLMTSPMVVLELVLMGTMYPNKKLNVALIGVGVLALVGFFMLIRVQTGINDEQFLRSMIPHHASAILMCEQANITDPEIRALCENIEAGQQSQVDFMKAKLNALEQ